MYSEEQPMPPHIRGLFAAVGAIVAVPLLVIAVLLSRTPRLVGAAIALGTGGVVLGAGLAVGLIVLLNPLRIHIEADTLTVRSGVFRTRTPLHAVVSCHPITCTRWGTGVAVRLATQWGRGPRSTQRTFVAPASGATGVEVLTERRQLWFSSRDPEVVCRLIGAGEKPG